MDHMCSFTIRGTSRTTFFAPDDWLWMNPRKDCAESQSFIPVRSIAPQGFKLLELLQTKGKKNSIRGFRNNVLAVCSELLYVVLLVGPCHPSIPILCTMISESHHLPGMNHSHGEGVGFLADAQCLLRTYLHFRKQSWKNDNIISGGAKRIWHKMRSQKVGRPHHYPFALFVSVLAHGRILIKPPPPPSRMPFDTDLTCSPRAYPKVAFEKKKNPKIHRPVASPCFRSLPTKPSKTCGPKKQFASQGIASIVRKRSGLDLAKSNLSYQKSSD